jgi:raffinose/stachyose/melibiose transport system substrate-binding protein
MLPPESRGVAEILGRAKAIQLYYDQALPPELGEVHKTTTQGLLGGTKTPEEAARLMEEKAREVARRGAP